MRNGFQTVSALFDASTPTSPKVPLGPLPGLNSIYDFTWDAFKAGITREAFLTKQLRYEGVCRHAFQILDCVSAAGFFMTVLRQGVDVLSLFGQDKPKNPFSTAYKATARTGLSRLLLQGCSLKNVKMTYLPGHFANFS